MEMDVDQLQAKQAELIAAVPYFAGLAIIIDDGSQKEEIEKALRDKGVAILVCPILDGRRGSQATTQITLYCENLVRLEVNPERNAGAGGANLSITRAWREILKAILAYHPSPGETFWAVPEQPLELSTWQPGLRTYDLFFVKQFTIA